MVYIHNVQPSKQAALDSKKNMFVQKLDVRSEKVKGTIDEEEIKVIYRRIDMYVCVYFPPAQPSSVEFGRIPHT